MKQSLILEKTEFNIDTWSEIINLQNTVNLKIDENWKNKSFDWKTAIILEAAELVDSIDWKWWKKVETDWKNIEIEMIDIFHFLISKAIELSLIEDFKVLMIAHNTMIFPKAVKDKVLSDRLKYSIVTEFIPFVAQDNYHNAFLIWLDMWYKLGHTADEAFNIYKMKYCLNIFRQDNGYKEGTYNKMWSGEEDNIFAQKFAEDIENNNDFIDKLYKKLDNKYKELFD